LSDERFAIKKGATTVRSNAAFVKMQFIDRKQFSKEDKGKYDADEKDSIIASAKDVGTHLFHDFCVKYLTDTIKKAIEEVWNTQFNNYRPAQLSKIPVGFELGETFKNAPFSLRPEQTEGVQFLQRRGNGVVAYDVGVGKTATAIALIADGMQKGLFTRPLVIVPKAVLQNWYNELKGIYATKDEYDNNGKLKYKRGDLVSPGLLPQYEVNMMGNLGTGEISKWTDAKGNLKPVASGTITLISYEAIEKFGFSQEAEGEFRTELIEILAQDTGSRNDVIARQRIESNISKALEGALVEFDDGLFDGLIVDEAHNFKNLFFEVAAEGEDEEGNKRQRSFNVQGSQSTRAIKLFALTHFIRHANRNRNTFGLTATPFTNSPLEIFSMLALFDYSVLKESGISNINAFFYNFVNESFEYVYTSKGTFEYKATVRSFNNVSVLQDVIQRSIIRKDGDEVEDVRKNRPKKIVLPLLKDESGIELSDEFKADSKIPPSELQVQQFKGLESYNVETTYDRNHKRTRFAT
jgi:N12 class adenine-specific DNA methylase